MSKFDKVILFVTKFVLGSIVTGFLSFWFLGVSMLILGVNCNSKINAAQIIFIIGFTGIPFYGSKILANKDN